MESKKKPADTLIGTGLNLNKATNLNSNTEEGSNPVASRSELAATLLDDTTEFSLADLFIEEQGANWKHVSKFHSWYRWDESRWLLDEKKGIWTEIRKSVEIVSKSKNETGIKVAKKIPAIESLLSAEKNVAELPENFDSNLMLLGCPSGVVDLETGILLEPERNHLITKNCLVTPEDRECPIFMSFLNRIFEDDQKVIGFIQRALGYALTGKTGEHKLFFFYGYGCNGKSVLLDVVAQIMGDYTRKAPTSLFLQTRNQEHATALAGLNSARFVQASELPDGAVWNDAQIKDLTSSDLQTARFMRGDFFDFTPQFKLFIAGNHQPSFRSVDEALRRRVVLIPFRVKIPVEEVDTQLSEKLKPEWGAILHWMVRGCVEWNKNGLQIPESIEKASSDYMEAEDTVGQFLRDKTVSIGEVGSSELFKAFNKWQEDSGVSNTWTQKKVTQAIKERGFVTRHTNRGSVFQEISLKGALCFACGGEGCRGCAS